MKHKNAHILAVLWLLVMVSIVASSITLLASGGVIGSGRWVSGEEAEMLQRYSRLEEIRRTLSDKYYQPVDDETLLTGAMRGMMGSLQDPYTFYYTPEEMALHDESTSGEYKGVGLLVQNNPEGYIEVIRVYAGGPADSAGVQVGDLIVRVDGIPVSGENSQTLSDAVNLMKGENESVVRVTVNRSGKPLDLDIKRGDVNVSNVASEILAGNLGYINLFQFSGDVVPAFQEALQDLQKGGADGLIIDLRNNPGGLLDDVVDIADMLLPEGCIVYIEDRAGSREDFYSDEEKVDLPLIVMVNEMSASASEILAAAVQDFERGTVVGTQTYGKGVVQTIASFDDNGAGMQYTSACYYTPKGRSINGCGVTPDVVVEADGYNSYSGIANPEADAQLRCAMELLLKKINGET